MNVDPDKSMQFYLTNPLRCKRTDGTWHGQKSMAHLAIVDLAGKEWSLQRISELFYCCLVTWKDYVIWEEINWIFVWNKSRVRFYFKSSKRSNNGTDVNAGQIPQLLYRVVTPENQTSNRQRDQIGPVYILKREFSRTVTKVRIYY